MGFTKFSLANKKAANVLILLSLLFVLFTLAQDFLRAELKHSAFYFSESFMFSSFWWLFAPLLFAQYIAVKHNNNERLIFKTAIIVLPIGIHLFAFPFLVWALSAAFYYHTFSFQQTLSYTIAEHLYLLVLIYAIPIFAFAFKIKKEKAVVEVQKVPKENQHITTILVADGNKKQNISVSSILYFSANPPYINIYVAGNKYLHSETLKSISAKLNEAQFIRIHKSTIVNMAMVDFYTTRPNGDCDITLKNQVQLKVSRNFAPCFKAEFAKTHPFAVK
jgi:DNA-binding LytR/AlgR family response regulator